FAWHNGVMAPGSRSPCASPETPPRSPPRPCHRDAIMTSPTPSASELISLLHADQLRRWQRGEPRRVEDYLKHHPGLAANAEQVVDLIYAELVLREQHGERPQLNEYLARFPDHAEALQRQFRLHLALQDSVLLDDLVPASASSTLVGD